MAEVKALVDSGATDSFIKPAFAKRMGIGLKELDAPKKIWNIDNTENKAGLITHCADLDVQTKGTHKTMRFLITDTGNEDIVLGYPWLAAYEPQINWQHAVIKEDAYPVVLRTTHPERRGVTIAFAPTESAEFSDDEKRQAIRELYTEWNEVRARTTATDLAIEAQQYTSATAIPEEYADFAKVFSEEESHRFPPPRPWDHAIEFTKDAPAAINCKIYPMSRDEDEALRKFLDEQLEKGYIRPSKSPYASSFFFVKKKDGKLRPVQDYRKINSFTVRNQYPLPLIQELITDLGNADIYTKLDVRWGYNNVRIKEGDEEKAAFKTRYGFFEPLVMPFGLNNAPATFQAMMDYLCGPTILKHELLGTIIRVYMDDIAIASQNGRAGHIAAVRDVLRIAKDNDLYFKPEKCVFGAPAIDYLGVILEKGVTRMDPVKVAGIRNWPTPTTVKQVRSFLGFCNFYRLFIKGFATHARPLNRLTRKDTDWHWGQTEEDAFTKLKTLVTSEPVLAHPDLRDQFEMEVDASGFAVGAVLMQRKEDGRRHPIGYYSATLNEAERNYDIYDLELLAIVKAFRHWRPLLAGSPHKTKVFSDHLNLQYWRSPQRISRRIAREVLELSEYDFEIHHIKGTANGRADALSRRPDYDQGDDDNKDVTVLPDALFVRATQVDTIMPTTLTIDSEEMERPDATYRQDEDYLRPWIDAHRLKKIEGTWYKDGRRVVTGGLYDKRSIISAHHTPPVYGHPGINKTSQLVGRSYWWPNLRQDVLDYVKGCAECQRHKANSRPTRAPLSPIYPNPEALPFETIALDFITKLPQSQGFDSILTVTDHDCTKAAVFIPCNEEITAEGTAALYAKHVFLRFGLPSKVISDRDPRFASKFTRELCNILGISQNVSTAYHPRTDGQSERTNQWLEQYLRFWTNERQDNWAAYLPIAEFTHNNWPHETTRTSPFYLLMGYNPRADWIDRPSPIPQVALRIDQFQEARAQAKALLIKAQKSWVKHKDTPKYKEGDLVWLEGRHLRTNQPTTKLAPKRHGPFKVTQVMSPVNYRLELPTQWSIHPVFHTDLLTRYHETATHGPNYQRPPPDLVDGEEEYEIEKILDSRRFGRTRKLQYLVKWKGYPDSENQWVDRNEVFADQAIQEFRALHPTYIRKAHCELSLPATSATISQPVYLRAMSSCSLPSQSTIDTVTQALVTTHGPATREDAIAVLSAFPDPTIGGTADSPGAQPIAGYDVSEAAERALLEGEAADSLVQHLDGRGDCEPVQVPHRVRARAAVEGDREGVEGRAAAAGEDAAAGGATPPLADPHWDGPEEDTPDDYPAAHPLIRSTTDTDDPRETPYSLNTDGSPMYKRDLGVLGPGSHQPLVTINTRVPSGFKANTGADYIPFRITSPDGVEREARYHQVIMGPDPMVVGIINESDKVYARPLYAAPHYNYGGKPIYPSVDMALFTEAFEDRARVDRCLDSLHDLSLTAEVKRYRAAHREQVRLNERIDDLIAAMGEVMGKVAGSQRRLEMANAMERIEDEAGTMVDYELTTRKKTRRGRKSAQQPQRTRILYQEEGVGASGRRT